MAIIAAARSPIGYALAHEEGEAFWLLGMLQTIKVGRADTNGQFGMLEIVVPAGLGSPWHVHPEEDDRAASPRPRAAPAARRSAAGPRATRAHR